MPKRPVVANGANDINPALPPILRVVSTTYSPKFGSCFVGDFVTDGGELVSSKGEKSAETGE